MTIHPVDSEIIKTLKSKQMGDEVTLIWGVGKASREKICGVYECIKDNHLHLRIATDYAHSHLVDFRLPLSFIAEVAE